MAPVLKLAVYFQETGNTVKITAYHFILRNRKINDFFPFFIQLISPSDTLAYFFFLILHGKAVLPCIQMIVFSQHQIYGWERQLKRHQEQFHHAQFRVAVLLSQIHRGHQMKHIEKSLYRTRVLIRCKLKDFYNPARYCGLPSVCCRISVQSRK